MPSSLLQFFQAGCFALLSVFVVFSLPWCVTIETACLPSGISGERQVSSKKAETFHCGRAARCAYKHQCPGQVVRTHASNSEVRRGGFTARGGQPCPCSHEALMHSLQPQVRTGFWVAAEV